MSRLPFFAIFVDHYTFRDASERIKHIETSQPWEKASLRIQIQSGLSETCLIPCDSPHNHALEKVRGQPPISLPLLFNSANTVSWRLLCAAVSSSDAFVRKKWIHIIYNTRF